MSIAMFIGPFLPISNAVGFKIFVLIFAVDGVREKLLSDLLRRTLDIVIDVTSRGTVDVTFFAVAVGFFFTFLDGFR